MPYTQEHKDATRERILGAARQLFNKRGFAEVSIDEVMADAGLTRGGFYRHFDTKDQLYAEAILQFGREAPPDWQCAFIQPETKGRDLARMIVNAYLSQEHFDDREHSCPMIGLPTDVARSGDTVKAAFRQIMEMMAGVFPANLEGGKKETREQALAMTALCVGGMVLARAVDDPKLAEQIRSAARNHVIGSTGWTDG